MRSGVSQTPPFASEPQQQDDPIEQAISSLPERAKEWLRQHRDYLLDPRKNAALQHHHWQAVDEAGGQQFTDTYYEALERLLGMRAPPASRQVPLAPRQAPPGPQVSAPPTRSTQSWTSGRPVQTGPALTAEERDFAASLGISPQEYQQQKKRMYELKPELRPRS
jgi:hypothetical protein